MAKKAVRGILRLKSSIYRKITEEFKHSPVICLVGVAGFEPAASWTRTMRDTKLRHTPISHLLYHGRAKSQGIFTVSIPGRWPSAHPLRFPGPWTEHYPSGYRFRRFRYRFLTISTRMALSTASTITPTSAKIAAHILVMPSAPRIRHSTLMPMAK